MTTTLAPATPGAGMRRPSSAAGLPSPAARRVLATRDARWARSLAQRLAAGGVQPNMVSLTGVGFALVSAAAFPLSARLGDDWRAVLLLTAAAGIQLRLLCNLLDGMLAVEQGLKSATGDIFNELPDRVADVAILLGAGYAASTFEHGALLGWAAALMALATAYVRVFGGSLGLTQHFVGPMAKQHRMFTLTVATLLAVVESVAGFAPRAISVGVLLIVAGSSATVVRRTRRIVREARAR